MIAIGGSNYITGILMLVILFLQIAMAFIFKHRHRILFSINGVLYLVAFLLNIVAPDNQKRQATSGTVTIISYGVFASLLVPNIYALGGIGGGRNLNMYKTFHFSISIVLISMWFGHRSI